MTFAQWLGQMYARRFTGKIELDFLNGIPRSWTPQGDRVAFDAVPVDKREKVAEAVTV